MCLLSSTGTGAERNVSLRVSDAPGWAHAPLSGAALSSARGALARWAAATAERAEAGAARNALEAYVVAAAAALRVDVAGVDDAGGSRAMGGDDEGAVGDKGSTADDDHGRTAAAGAWDEASAVDDARDDSGDKGNAGNGGMAGDDDDDDGSHGHGGGETAGSDDGGSHGHGHGVTGGAVPLPRDSWRRYGSSAALSALEAALEELDEWLGSADGAAAGAAALRSRLRAIKVRCAAVGREGFVGGPRGGYTRMMMQLPMPQGDSRVCLAWQMNAACIFLEKDKPDGSSRFVLMSLWATVRYRSVPGSYSVSWYQSAMLSIGAGQPHNWCRAALLSVCAGQPRYTSFLFRCSTLSIVVRTVHMPACH